MRLLFSTYGSHGSRGGFAELPLACVGVPLVVVVLVVPAMSAGVGHDRACGGNRRFTGWDP